MSPWVHHLGRCVMGHILSHSRLLGEGGDWGESATSICRLARIVGKPLVHFAGAQIPSRRQIFEHAHGEMVAMLEVHAEHELRLWSPDLSSPPGNKGLPFQRLATQEAPYIGGRSRFLTPLWRFLPIGGLDQRHCDTSLLDAHTDARCLRRTGTGAPPRAYSKPLIKLQHFDATGYDIFILVSLTPHLTPTCVDNDERQRTRSIRWRSIFQVLCTSVDDPGRASAR